MKKDKLTTLDEGLKKVLDETCWWLGINPDEDQDVAEYLERVYEKVQEGKAEFASDDN